MEDNLHFRKALLESFNENTADLEILFLGSSLINTDFESFEQYFQAEENIKWYARLRKNNNGETEYAIIVALYFGVLQALMPTIGYFLGATFEELVTKIDHWLAFILLSAIGINMLKEASSKETESFNDEVNFKTMVVLALATSIDALAIGITFAFLRVNLLISVLMIGIITFAISLIGVKIGNKFGDKYEKKAEVVGGLILIILGVEILLEHLGVF